MDPQNVNAAVVDNKLSLVWTSTIETRASIVSISQNNEFTKAPRHFVIPPTKLEMKEGELVPGETSVRLDIGAGIWFYRIGHCVGTSEKGIVHWSGIYGPVAISSIKDIVPLEANPYDVIHTQSIINGFRIFTSKSDAAIILAEVCRNTTFSAADTKWQYTKFFGHGSIDIYGMDHNNTYSIRFSVFLPESSVFPTSSIKIVSRPIIFNNKRSARPVSIYDNGDRATNAADKAILTDLKRNANIRFASHTDYLRFKAAMEKVAETKHKVY